MTVLKHLELLLVVWGETFERHTKTLSSNLKNFIALENGKNTKQINIQQQHMFKIDKLQLKDWQNGTCRHCHRCCVSFSRSLSIFVNENNVQMRRYFTCSHILMHSISTYLLFIAQLYVNLTGCVPVHVWAKRKTASQPKHWKEERNRNSKVTDNSKYIEMLKGHDNKSRMKRR